MSKNRNENGNQETCYWQKNSQSEQAKMMYEDKNGSMITNENESQEQIHQYWENPQPNKTKLENKKENSTRNQCQP